MISLRITCSRILVALPLVLCMGTATASSAAEPPQKADDLLRTAVANEKLSANDGYFSWVDRLQKTKGSVTKIMVSTPQGILGRTVAINDAPLSADDRKQDDDRINRLLDPAKMRDKASKQREDQQRIERLLMALPDAFHCEYSATVHDDRNVRLECSPNSHFSAPNYESQVLLGMKAVILVDRDESRIARIEGNLFKDVNFGWGFIGRLNHGGRIEITQSKVAGKHWGIQRMQLIFDGRIVMVKPLHIEETETSWDYHPVPSMGVAQALQYLRASTPNLKPTH
jgi:hypothetical protein